MGKQSREDEPLFDQSILLPTGRHTPWLDWQPTELPLPSGKFRATPTRRAATHLGFFRDPPISTWDIKTGTPATPAFPRGLKREPSGQSLLTQAAKSQSGRGITHNLKHFHRFNKATIHETLPLVKPSAPPLLLSRSPGALAQKRSGASDQLGIGIYELGLKRVGSSSHVRKDSHSSGRSPGRRTGSPSRVARASPSPERSERSRSPVRSNRQGGSGRRTSSSSQQSPGESPGRREPSTGSPRRMMPFLRQESWEVPKTIAHAAKRISMKRHVVMPVPGKVFVRTCARHPGSGTRAFIEDPNKRYSRQEIATFCSHLKGECDRKTLDLARLALEREPSDRSRAHIQHIMQFLQFCPDFNDCTTVEKFIIAKIARYVVCYAGDTVMRDEDRDEFLLIVLTGAVAATAKNLPEGQMLRTCFAFGNTSLPSMHRGYQALDTFLEETEEVQPGKAFVSKSFTELVFVDCEEYRANYESYAAVVREGPINVSYVPSFLASLDIFRRWSWHDIVELSREVEGIQVDSGIELFRQGIPVDGVHILQKGNCKIESFRDDRASRSYGLKISLTADSDGNPQLNLSKPYAHRRKVLVGSCESRTVFGEELGEDLLHDSHRLYTVKSTSSCSFLFLPKAVLESLTLNNLASTCDVASSKQTLVRMTEDKDVSKAKRFERKHELEKELKVLSMCRKKWVTPRAEHLLETNIPGRIMRTDPQDQGLDESVDSIPDQDGRDSL